LLSKRRVKNTVLVNERRLISRAAGSYPLAAKQRAASIAIAPCQEAPKKFRRDRIKVVAKAATVLRPRLQASGRCSG
jgi:hypothetical protein